MKNNESFKKYLNNKSPQIEKILKEKIINEKKIKMLCWGGIPNEYRAFCYKILLKCSPSNLKDFEVFDNELNKKYLKKQENYKENKKNEHQIKIDVKRLGNSGFISNNKDMIIKEQEIYLNILKLYAYEEPTVGYVQGMADILVPFYKTFYNEKHVESIIFFTFSSFMDQFKENLIGQQHGTEVLVYKMIGILKYQDNEIYEHSIKTKLDFRLCVFRWFNVIFAREFEQSIYFIILDTLLTTDDYNLFAIHFAISIIIKYREIILGNKEPEENIIFLQNLKIINWKIEDLLFLFSNVYLQTHNGK